MKSLSRVILVTACAVLLGAQGLLADPQGYGHWHYGISHRPRLLYLSGEVNTIRSRLISGIYHHLWSNNFYPRHSADQLFGVFERADDDPRPRPDRSTAAEAAQVAKDAAFVYAMGVDANGALIGKPEEFLQGSRARDFACSGPRCVGG